MQKDAIVNLLTIPLLQHTYAYFTEASNLETWFHHNCVVKQGTWQLNTFLCMWEVICSDHWNMQWKATLRNLENLWFSTRKFELQNNGSYNYYRKLQCLTYHKCYLPLLLNHIKKVNIFLFTKSNDAIRKQEIFFHSFLFKFLNVQLHIYLNCNNDTKKGGQMFSF